MKILKHLVPVKDMCPALISTGTEKLLPYTASKDFVVRAKDDGKVKEYDKESNMLVLEYKDGSHELVNLNTVVVKNSGGGFYLPNQLQTDFKVGQKFKKNDVIAADRNFFSKHYDGTKFCIGTLCKVAIMSSFATFEDPKLVTQNLAERMTTEMIMKKHIILGKNATVSYIAKKGQNVNVGDDLIKFEQSNDEEAMNALLKNIGDDMKEEIKNLGKSALHSKYEGVIEDVRIYSTWDLDELSPSLQKIVGGYWKEVRRKKNLARKYKITDATYSGSTFYLNDEPTKPDEKEKIKGYKVDGGGVIIEFYIKYLDVVGVGDKLCDFAALKGVTCTVVPKGEEPYTVNKPDEEISTIFPVSSVCARMTSGIIPTMFGQKVLVELKNKLREFYDAGKNRK